MRRRRSWALPLLLVCSCSWALDFDGLQQGGGSGGSAQSEGGSATQPTDAGSTSTSAGEGGVAGAGGQGGSVASVGGAAGSTAVAGSAGDAGTECELSCPDDDDDPCTTPLCVDGLNGPECAVARNEGLVFLEELPPLLADRFRQIGLRTYQPYEAASSPHFLLTAAERNGEAVDLAIHSLATPAASELTLRSRLRDLADLEAFEPISAADVIRGSTDVEPTAYFAAHDASVGTSWVFQVHLDTEFKPQRIFASASYLVPSDHDRPRHRPSAHAVGYNRDSAWIDARGRVQWRRDDEPISNSWTLPVSGDTPASLVSVISGRPDECIVTYTVPGAGVFQARAGGTTNAPHRPYLEDPVPYTECQQGGSYGALAVAASASNQILLGWTKSSADRDVGDAAFYSCVSVNCAMQPSDCENPEFSSQRAVALAAVRFPSDTADIGYYVQLAASGPQASTSARAFRTGVKEGVRRATQLGEAVLLSARTVGPADEQGPLTDPAVAISGNQVIAAWVESAAAAQDRLRVQRYALCPAP